MNKGHFGDSDQGLVIRCLGTVTVVHEGVLCTSLGTRKAVAMLIYLACNEQPVSRETLAALFWDDVPEANARASLNVAVSQLRKQLPDYIVATRETIALDRTLPLWLDAKVLARQWLERQDRNRAQNALTESELEELEAITTLYQGQFLDTLSVSSSAAFEEWVRFERERLQQFAIAAFEALATAHLHRGDYQKATHVLQRLLHFDPFRESSHQLLMLLLARQGQRNAALAHYQACRSLFEEELGIAPGRELQALYKRIAEPPARYPLPARPSFTAGRETEWQEIGRRLRDPNCRLLTLTGSGGSGKTHMALEVAWRQRDEFLSGVCFVPMADLGSAAELIAAMATAVGLQRQEVEKTKEQLLHFVRDREILLVLDGFDPLLASAFLLAELLAQAPLLKILITSRERLELAEAWSFALDGLSYPKDSGESEMPLAELESEYGAVEMLAHEALKFGITLQDDRLERAAVIRVCQLVDGLPLGIRLAATWLPILTCREIASQLEERLDFLVSGSNSERDKQQQLSSLLAHSLSSLPAEERKAYLRLAVFPGSFDRQAAEEVAGAAPAVLRLLIAKSLVRGALKVPISRGAAHTRFILPRLLRQYLLEQLQDEPEEEEQALDAHAAYFIALLEKRWPILRGPEQLHALLEIEAEHANIRQAWARAIDLMRVKWLDQASESLGEYYLRRGHYQTGDFVFNSALRRVNQTGEARALQGRLLAWQGVFKIALGNTERGRILLRESLKQLRAIGGSTRRDTAFVYLQLSRLAARRNLARAERLCRRSVSLFKATGDIRDVGIALHQMASVKDRRGQKEAALELYAVSHHYLEACGDRFSIASLLSDWASAAAGQGRLAEAEELARSAHGLYQQLDNRTSQAEMLQQMGQLLIWQGKQEEAVVLLDTSLSLYEQLGYQRRVPQVQVLRAGALANCGKYDETTLVLREVIAQAREMEDQAARASALWLMGWVCLATGGLEAAEEKLKHSLALYRQLGDAIGAGHAHAALARVELSQQNYHHVEMHLLRSFLLAKEVRYPHSALAAIGSTALLFAERGQAERAVELMALATRYPVMNGSQLFHDCVSSPLKAMCGSLTPQRLEDARLRGEKLDLWVTVDEVLTGLTVPEVGS